jgi:hypothetical protein
MSTTSNTADNQFNLTTEEKNLVIGALALLGFIALCVFFLVLCDPLLFRINDDDDDDGDDFDPELYKAPPWILQQQVPIQQTQPVVTREAPQLQQTPHQQLTLSTTQQLAAPPPPRPPPPSSQAVPIMHETQSQTELVPSQHSQRPAQQPPAIQASDNRPQYLPIISAGPESFWNDPQRQRQQQVAAQRARPPTSPDTTTTFLAAAYNTPNGGALEPVPETTYEDLSIQEQPQNASNGSKIGHDDSSSRRDTTGREDTFHDEEETSTVEIFSYTPRQSLASLPEEVKKFDDKGGAVSPITPAHFGSPPPTKRGDSALARPTTPISISSSISLNAIRTLIPRYSHKAERQRFVILNVLLIVITASIGTAAIVQVYT